MLIFLYGDDSFRSRQKLSEIKNKYLQSDKSGSGLSSFCLPEDKNVFGKMEEVFGMGNLFFAKRLLIIKNLISDGSDEEQKSALSFFEKNLERVSESQDNVVVFWEKETPKKTNAVFKILEKNSKSQKFEKLSGIKLSQSILKRLKEIDSELEISKSALERLAAFCGDDPERLEGEMQKLANYADGKMIVEGDVEDLVSSQADANVFKTIDALSSGDKKTALRLFYDHLQKGDDPFYLMSMFVYQFRNLLKVSDMREKNFPEGEIAKITKLHPFVVKKSLYQLRGFDFSRLKEIYAKLLEIDVKVKTGKIDIRVALDKFVAEM